MTARIASPLFGKRERTIKHSDRPVFAGAYLNGHRINSALRCSIPTFKIVVQPYRNS